SAGALLMHPPCQNNIEMSQTVRVGRAAQCRRDDRPGSVPSRHFLPGGSTRRARLRTAGEGARLRAFPGSPEGESARLLNQMLTITFIHSPKRDGAGAECGRLSRGHSPLERREHRVWDMAMTAVEEAPGQ